MEALGSGPRRRRTGAGAWSDRHKGAFHCIALALILVGFTILVTFIYGTKLSPEVSIHMPPARVSKSRRRAECAALSNIQVCAHRATAAELLSHAAAASGSVSSGSGAAAAAATGRAGGSAGGAARQAGLSSSSGAAKGSGGAAGGVSAGATASPDAQVPFHVRLQALALRGILCHDVDLVTTLDGQLLVGHPSDLQAFWQEEARKQTQAALRKYGVTTTTDVQTMPLGTLTALTGTGSATPAGSQSLRARFPLLQEVVSLFTQLSAAHNISSAAAAAAAAAASAAGASMAGAGAGAAAGAGTAAGTRGAGVSVGGMGAAGQQRAGGAGGLRTRPGMGHHRRLHGEAVQAVQGLAGSVGHGVWEEQGEGHEADAQAVAEAVQHEAEEEDWSWLLQPDFQGHSQGTHLQQSASNSSSRGTGRGPSDTKDAQHGQEHEDVSWHRRQLFGGAAGASTTAGLGSTSTKAPSGTGSTGSSTGGSTGGGTAAGAGASLSRARAAVAAGPKPKPMLFVEFKDKAMSLKALRGVSDMVAAVGMGQQVAVWFPSHLQAWDAVLQGMGRQSMAMRTARAYVDSIPVPSGATSATPSGGPVRMPLLHKMQKSDLSFDLLGPSLLARPDKFLTDAAASGRPLVLWTVDTEEALDKAIKLGASYIISNAPLKMKAALDERIVSMCGASWHKQHSG